MTKTLTIYKEDGTLQGHPEIEPRPLREDAEAISALGVKIVGEGRHEQLPIFVSARVGATTGWANVFDIDEAGLTRHQLFLLSGLGFKIWSFAAAPLETGKVAGGVEPFASSALLDAARLLAAHANPDRIADLAGYVIRVYETGDLLTQDYRLDRVNFETDPATRRIIRHWFG